MATLSSFFGDAVGTGQVNDVTDPRQLPISIQYHPYVKTWTNTNDNATEEVFWYTSIPTFLHMYNDEWSSVYTDYAWGNPNFTQPGMVDKYWKATDNSSIMGGYLIYDPVNVGTYQTVADHSGYGGYLNWVVGLGNQAQPAGTLTYIKITVDGQEYEFEGVLHYRNDEPNSSWERMVWGTWVNSTATYTNPYSGGMFGGQHGDLGTGRHNRNRFLSINPTSQVQNKTENSCQLITPSEIMNTRGMQALRFENSVKVEVKNVPPEGATQSVAGFSNYSCCSITRDLTLPGL